MSLFGLKAILKVSNPSIVAVGAVVGAATVTVFLISNLQTDTSALPSQLELARMREVESISFREPIAAGIETRLRLAQSIRRLPEYANAYVDESLRTLAPLGFRAAASLRRTAVDVLLAMDDPSRAYTVAVQIQHRNHAFCDDLKSQAFDDLFRYWVQRDRSAALSCVRSGLASGASNMRSTQPTIEYFAKSDPTIARDVFIQLIASFPEDLPLLGTQGAQLLACSRMMMPLDETVVLRCIEKMWKSILVHGFDADGPTIASEYDTAVGKIYTHTAEQTVLWELTAITRLVNPELFDHIRSELSGQARLIANIPNNDLTRSSTPVGTFTSWTSPSSDRPANGGLLSPLDRYSAVQKAYSKWAISDERSLDEARTATSEVDRIRLLSNVLKSTTSRSIARSAVTSLYPILVDFCESEDMRRSQEYYPRCTTLYNTIAWHVRSNGIPLPMTVRMPPSLAARMLLIGRKDLIRPNEVIKYGDPD